MQPSHACDKMNQESCGLVWRVCTVGYYLVAAHTKGVVNLARSSYGPPSFFFIFT